MIAFTLLSLSILIGQTTFPVRIAPTHEFSQTPKHRLLPSSDRAQEGVVLFHSPGISRQSIIDLSEQFSNSQIDVVRKVSKNSFVTSPGFDLNAFRAKIATTNKLLLISEKAEQVVPNDDYFDRMVDGDVVAVFRADSVRNLNRMLVSSQPELCFGPLNGQDDLLRSHVFVDLGSPLPGYANIPFEATLKETVGLIWHEVGSQLVIDDTRLIVTHQSKLGLEAAHPFRVHIRQEGVSSSWTYDFESRWSQGDSPQKEFMADSQRLVKASQHQLAPNNKTKEFIIDCAQPFKFWKGISVYRSTKISGYYSHVKIP